MCALEVNNTAKKSYLKAKSTKDYFLADQKI